MVSWIPGWLEKISAENKAPIAKAGQNLTVYYPETSVILDASKSTDDGTIVSYKWSQLR